MATDTKRATRAAFRARVTVLGASVDESMWSDRINLSIDAPCGYVWEANGEPSLVCAIGDGAGALAEAYADALDRMGYGLRLATDAECEEIEYDRDEPWRAAAGSPDRLA